MQKVRPSRSRVGIGVEHDVDAARLHAQLLRAGRSTCVVQRRQLARASSVDVLGQRRADVISSRELALLLVEAARACCGSCGGCSREDDRAVAEHRAEVRVVHADRHEHDVGMRPPAMALNVSNWPDQRGALRWLDPLVGPEQARVERRTRARQVHERDRVLLVLLVARASAVSAWCERADRWHWRSPHVSASAALVDLGMSGTPSPEASESPIAQHEPVLQVDLLASPARGAGSCTDTSVGPEAAGPGRRGVQPFVVLRLAPRPSTCASACSHGSALNADVPRVRVRSPRARPGSASGRRASRRSGVCILWSMSSFGTLRRILRSCAVGSTIADLEVDLPRHRVHLVVRVRSRPSRAAPWPCRRSRR